MKKQNDSKRIVQKKKKNKIFAVMCFFRITKSFFFLQASIL